MNALAYFMLAGLAALFICLRIQNERQKRQRYKTRLDMDVEVQFQESVDPHDHMRRGSIMLTLHRCDDDVKGIVIKKVSFSDDVFYVPGFDTLYFKKRITIKANSFPRVSGYAVITCVDSKESSCT